jgi:hypothetical protein
LLVKMAAPLQVLIASVLAKPDLVQRKISALVIIWKIVALFKKLITNFLRSLIWKRCFYYKKRTLVVLIPFAIRHPYLANDRKIIVKVLLIPSHGRVHTRSIKSEIGILKMVL